jgi:hypothetical protein
VVLMAKRNWTIWHSVRDENGNYSWAIVDNMVCTRTAHGQKCTQKANDAVEKALELRDDAIHALIDAEMKYSDALDVWAPLYDEMKARDPSRVTAPPWRRMH